MGLWRGDWLLFGWGKERMLAKGENMKACCYLLFALALAIFIACGGGAASSVNSSVSSESAEEPKKSTYGQAGDSATETDLAVRAKREIKSRLKYPDNATFHWGRDVNLRGNRWIVTGKVDAANSFGAKLTRDYIVSFELISAEAKHWRLKGVIVGDEILYIDDSEEPQPEPEPPPPVPVVIQPELPKPTPVPADPAPEPVKPKRQSRLWTSADKQFSVEAEFISFGAGKVKLRRIDNGKELLLNIEQLSAEDQAWVRSKLN